MVLRDTLRYAHGADHVEAALGAAKLELLQIADAAVRQENGVPVPGFVVVASNAPRSLARSKS